MDIVNIKFPVKCKNTGELCGNYQSYLESKHWKDLKEEFLFNLPIQKRSCYICRSRKIEIHHRTYSHIGNEKYKDLVCLCRYHHQLVHDLVTTKEISLKNAHSKVMKEERRKPDKNLFKKVVPFRNRIIGISKLVPSSKKYLIEKYKYKCKEFPLLKMYLLLDKKPEGYSYMYVWTFGASYKIPFWLVGENGFIFGTNKYEAEFLAFKKIIDGIPQIKKQKFKINLHVEQGHLSVLDAAIVRLLSINREVLQKRIKNHPQISLVSDSVLYSLKQLRKEHDFLTLNTTLEEFENILKTKEVHPEKEFLKNNIP